MPEHIFESLAADWRHAEHSAAHRMRELMGIGHHDAPTGGTQTPAIRPVNLAAAAAAAPPEGDTMSLASEVEQGWQATKNEMAKFEASLPGLLERAKAFEASPFAAIAEKAAASILPPEAVQLAVNAADRAIDDLAALYAPQQDGQPAQPAAPAQPAPAQ